MATRIAGPSDDRAFEQLADEGLDFADDPGASPPPIPVPPAAPAARAPHAPAPLDEYEHLSWSRWSLPWLLSAVSHFSVVLLLALIVRMSPNIDWSKPRGTGKTGQMTVTYAGGDGGGLGDGGLLDTPIDSTDPPSKYFSDDENSAATASSPFDPAIETASTNPGGNPMGVAGGAGSAAASNAFASVVSDRPPVDLTSVLPTGQSAFADVIAEGGGAGPAKKLTQGGKSSNRTKGGYARTGVFGVEGEGYKFVYVFDRSGSMDGHGGAPLAAAKSQLLASINDLGQTHQFQIIFYNDHPRVYNLSGAPGRLVFANEQNKRLAERFVASITGDGATEHMEALEMALRMAPDVIFFLTDADEPRMSQGQLDQIRRANKGSAINTIEFGYGSAWEGENFLIQLARENGGHHVYVDVAKLPPPRK